MRWAGTPAGAMRRRANGARANWRKAWDSRLLGRSAAGRRVKMARLERADEGCRSREVGWVGSAREVGGQGACDEFTPPEQRARAEHRLVLSIAHAKRRPGRSRERGGERGAPNRVQGDGWLDEAAGKACGCRRPPAGLLTPGACPAAASVCLPAGTCGGAARRGSKGVGGASCEGCGARPARATHWPGTSGRTRVGRA